MLLLKMLEKDRFEAIIGSHPQIEIDILENGYSGKFEQATYRPGNDVHIYMGISRKSKFSSQIEHINQTIILMMKDGKIQEIVNQYLKWNAVCKLSLFNNSA